MAGLYDWVRETVVETFGLWDVVRVGFSWRRYYLDHTLQVENLSLRLGREIGADPDQLRVAAMLHDITKRYDGAILRDAENRAVVVGLIRDARSAGASFLGIFHDDAVRAEVADRVIDVTRFAGTLQ